MMRLPALLPLVASCLAHGQPTYHRIEGLPGSYSPSPRAISAKGQFIVGYVDFHSSATPSRGFVWTLHDGLELLPSLPNAESARAVGVSGDGRVIVGQTRVSGSYVAVRWLRDEGVEELPVPDGWRAEAAWGVSDDGRAVVGEVRTSDNQQLACRWVDDQMPEILTESEQTDRSAAYGISRNGEYITGSMWDAANGERVFMWSEAGGFVELVLPPTPGWNAGFCVSNDGRTVAGMTNSTASVWRADRGWMRMDRRPLDLFSWMSGLTAHGRFAVGELLTDTFAEIGLYWRDDTDFIRNWYAVTDPLFDPPGSSSEVFAIYDVSADGTSLVCSDLGGLWLVTGLPRIDSPCMPDFTNDGVLDLADVQEFLSRYAAGSVEADFILDGTLNFFDVQKFLNQFARGCD